MFQNYLLLFHAKGFSHANNMVKPYSMQYLFTSEPLTNITQCLDVVSQFGV